MFLSEEQYNHVMDVWQGKLPKSLLLEKLTKWAKRRWNIKIYDYACYCPRSDLPTGLKIIVWDEREEGKFIERGGINYNHEIQEKFQKKFASLARKYQVHPDYHDWKKIYVCSDTLKDEIRKRTLHQAEDEIKALKQKHPDIWRIMIGFGCVDFFYETNEQVEKHKSDGVSEGLRQACGDIIRKYDTYGVYPEGVPGLFDSHQTLDEKYDGNFYFYYQ